MYASLPGSSVADRAKRRRTGATPLFEALVRAWGGAGFHKPRTGPLGVAPVRISLCGKAIKPMRKAGVDDSSERHRNGWYAHDRGWQLRQDLGPHVSIRRANLRPGPVPHKIRYSESVYRRPAQQSGLADSLQPSSSPQCIGVCQSGAVSSGGRDRG